MNRAVHILFIGEKPVIQDPEIRIREELSKDRIHTKACLIMQAEMQEKSASTGDVKNKKLEKIF
jgi:hypothetical protein